MLKVSAIGASTLCPSFGIGDIQYLSNDIIDYRKKCGLFGEGQATLVHLSQWWDHLT